jgi:PAS domain S-box-containing protein
MAYMQYKREMHKYQCNDIEIMDGYQQEISLIKKVLNENPKGMTVTDISRKIKVNRNSVAKYLDIMRISGHVEMLTFGPAKVFFPSRRVPISNMINFTSDYILIFDANQKITMVNDPLLDFLKAKRDNIIGQTIYDLINNIFEDKKEVSEAIDEALDGKDCAIELDLDFEGESVHFKIRIVPTTFEDGRQGVTIIINNLTDYIVAENALRESEKNFRSLLEKIGKKKR